MQRGNSVLLRSVFSAAIVSAALRAATFSGVDRGGSLPNEKVWETGPIPVRSKLARKPPGIVALAFLNPASPQARLNALSTNLIGLGKSRGGNVGRGGSLTSDPIPQSCAADVRHSE
jgi:hypothetical protein